MAATQAPSLLRRLVLINPMPTSCAARGVAADDRRVTLIYGEGGARTQAETEFFAVNWLGAHVLDPPRGRVRVLDDASLRWATPRAVTTVAEEIARLLR